MCTIRIQNRITTQTDEEVEYLMTPSPVLRAKRHVLCSYLAV